jgi:hypothetical protein
MYGKLELTDRLPDPLTLRHGQIQVRATLYPCSLLRLWRDRRLFVWHAVNGSAV